MKSFSKFCLIVAGIFVVLGIVGVTAGMALGARPSQFLHMVHYRNSGWLWNPLNIVRDWKEEAEDWRDDALDWKEEALEWKEDAEDWMDEPLDEIDSWGDDLALHWKDYGLEDLKRIVEPSSGTVDNFEGFYGSAETKTLKLDLSQSIVRFYTHENENIWIQGANAQKYLEIADNGDTLVLTDHRKRNVKPVVLEIYLPERTLKELEINLDATLFYAGDLAAEKIEIEMGAGEAEIDAVHTKKLEMELGAGIFTLGEITVDEKAKLGVGTGELVVNRFTGGNLDLECGVGHIFMTAAGKETDYNYELSCGIGNLELNGESYAGLGHEQTINNHASKKITMECGIGEIELKFEE